MPDKNATVLGWRPRGDMGGYRIRRGGPPHAAAQHRDGDLDRRRAVVVLWSNRSVALDGPGRRWPAHRAQHPRGRINEHVGEWNRYLI